MLVWRVTVDGENALTHAMYKHWIIMRKASVPSFLPQLFFTNEVNVSAYRFKFIHWVLECFTLLSKWFIFRSFFFFFSKMHDSIVRCIILQKYFNIQRSHIWWITNEEILNIFTIFIIIIFLSEIHVANPVSSALNMFG